jgi:hypothetical protein
MAISECGSTWWAKKTFFSRVAEPGIEPVTTRLLPTDAVSGADEQQLHYSMQVVQFTVVK